MTITHDDLDTALVPQSVKRQLLARVLLLAAGYGLTKAAQRTAEDATRLMRLALGPTAGLPALTWPGERRRARAVVQAAQAVVDDAPLDADPGAEVEHEPADGFAMCGERFMGTDHAWHTCDWFPGPDGERVFHRHKRFINPAGSNAQVVEDEETLKLRHRDWNWTPDDEPHEHQHAEVADGPADEPDEP